MDRKRRAMKKGRGKYVLDVMEHAASLIDYQNEGHWALVNKHTADYFDGLSSLTSLGHTPDRLNLVLLVLVVSFKLYDYGAFGDTLKGYLGTLKTFRGTPLYRR
jgi:hypothetical protein